MIWWGVLVSVLSGAGAAIENGTTCSDVRQAFVVRNIGGAQLVPERWTKGNDLEVCASPRTCCSKSMEEQYKEAVKKDLKNMLQGAGSYFKTLITTSSTKFRDTFLEMVQIAENSTNALFSDVYQFMEVQTRVPLSELFADMLAFMSGQDVFLNERVDAFFDSLFPIAYHHSINSEEKEFSEDYKECLRTAQFDLRPFGDLPEKINSRITRSFEAARTFLDSLQLGVEVLNTTEHMDFGSECAKAHVRLTYCPHCQNLIHAKPCTGMCLNVMRGCLSGVSELDGSWSEFVSALERYTSGMVGTYNIEHVLSTLDTKISETVSYLMTNSAEVTKRLKQKCWPPRRVSRETPQRSVPAPAKTEATKLASDTSLYMLLQNFILKLSDSKDFYSTLADRMCNEGHLVVKGKCWNGTALDEYRKSVAGIGIQKYNPEMQSPRVREATINKMNDKLQHVKQMLSQRVAASVPQSDSSMISEGGSGSGGDWKILDDEDYAGASGSGDFHKEEKPDLHFDNKGKNHEVSGATIRKIPFALVFCCILLLQMFKK